MGKKYDLLKLFTSAQSFGATLGHEKKAVEHLGWQRVVVKKTGGYEYYRYEKIMN